MLVADSAWELCSGTWLRELCRPRPTAGVDIGVGVWLCFASDCHSSSGCRLLCPAEATHSTEAPTTNCYNEQSRRSHITST